MRNRMQIWAVTLVLFAVTTLRVTLVYLAYPDRSTGALVDWSLVALWLVLPLVVVWRQVRGSSDADVRRDAALQLAIVGYLPLLVAMRLVTRLIE